MDLTEGYRYPAGQTVSKNGTTRLRECAPLQQCEAIRQRRTPSYHYLALIVYQMMKTVGREKVLSGVLLSVRQLS
jgi:hypothetical protein